MASIAESMAGDHASARRLLDEAHVTAAGLAYPTGTVSLLQARAFNVFFEADLGEVSSAATEGARLAQEAGDPYALEMMLLNLGSAALLAGDLDESRPLLAQGLRIAHQIDDRVGQFYLLDALGCHAALSGQPRLAARLLGAADTVRTETGANVMRFLVPALAQAKASTVAALGAARFAAEFAAGAHLDRDTAPALALGSPADNPATAAASRAGTA